MAYYLAIFNTITDVTSYVDHTVHLTKSFLQAVLQMLLSQKYNSCMLCVPMFSFVPRSCYVYQALKLFVCFCERRQRKRS